MPSISRKICGKHGIYTGAKCSECKAERDKHYNKTSRNEEATAFYNSTKWRKVRKQVLIRDGGVCCVCGCANQKMIVDHIKEISDGGCKLCYDNLRTVCVSCHNTITAENKKNRGQ
ncbi:HNH endonuclease [Sulfurimonas sp. NW15]|uniref:HNH endonuclease n=1 Tax=Sulfurimonas TaxID=202746 RepID=UPI00125F915F|nr:HNH endonuclease signature motif containing protein [Sulfurimonas hydrogeniphila]